MRAWIGSIALLMMIGTALRLWDLGRLPGINGDEAWYGVQVLGNAPVSQWTTPSGLPLNPFYMAPLAVELRAWPTLSFAALRGVAVASGILTFLAPFWVLRRSLGAAVAANTALLLCCLPIQIAYSRFGWDTCQSGLAALLCLASSFGQRPALSALALLAALLVHPVNVFVVPMMIAIEMGWLLEPVVNERRRPSRRAVLKATGAIAGILTIALVYRQFLPSGSLPGGSFWQRATRAPDWLELLQLLGEFVNGISIYRYIIGPVSPLNALVHDLLFWGCWTPLWIFGAHELWRQRAVLRFSFLGGFIASLACFYLLAGLEPLRPNFERYSMWLGSSVCIVTAILIEAVSSRSVRIRSTTGVVVHIACLTMLGAFYANYFRPLATTGGAAHWTFRTGPVEPKEAALKLVLEKAPGNGPLTILAEDWWMYWPIRYLTSRTPRIEVLLPGDPRFEHSRRPKGSRPQTAFALGFLGGVFEKTIAGERNATPFATVPDAAGRPLIQIWEVEIDD